MIRVTGSISIDERGIEERFVQASGPGGQNVNKVATAVQLRFDPVAAGLPGSLRMRLARLAGRRMSQAGILLLDARRFRSQERNRADARERLLELIREAARPVRPRIATAPGAAARARRLEAKQHRSRIKRTRTKAPRNED